MKVREVNKEHYQASPSPAETGSSSNSHKASNSVSPSVSISESASPSESSETLPVSGLLTDYFGWFRVFLNSAFINASTDKKE